MHHRIKNTLTNALGLTQQSFRHATDLAEASRSIEQRLIAMGKAHDLLMQNDWIKADIEQVVKDAVRAYVGDGTRMTTAGPSIELPSKAALSLALLLNELSTNALKYGAWSNAVGVVEISWELNRDDFRFHWIPERDGPTVTLPSRTSFGTRLIGEVLPAGFGSRGPLSYEPTGFRFELVAPATSLTSK
jgi:two-component sensor histidine kinase